jgi:UDP-glucose 4-epimerase
MAVLVTGGAGYIGSHMVLHLTDAGEEVIVLDDLSTGFAWAVDRRAHLVQGNAGDIELVSRITSERHVDAIIHFAGSIVVPESVANPLAYYANNTATSRNLLEAAVRNGIRHFIFSSTAAVYGNAGLAPVTEDAELRPTSPYGRSKLMTEMMLADVAAAHPLTYGVLRYFNVSGADPLGRSGQSSPTATHLIKVATQAALGLRPNVSIYGTDYPTPDGTGVRDYVHVSDLIRAHAALLSHLRLGGSSATLNCGYGRGFSVREVLDAVRRAAGRGFEILEGPRRAGDAASVVAHADAIRRILDWAPRFDQLDTIVQSALTWESRLSQTSPKDRVGQRLVSPQIT